MNSNVNHPQHYNQSKFETIDEMAIVFGLEATYSFCICNAWKYRSRAPYKDNLAEDMKKSDWYLNKAAELLKQMKEGNYGNIERIQKGCKR